MAQSRSARVLINESQHPYIVELGIGGELLDVELNRRIVGFHKSHRTQPRHGRTVLRQGEVYYRWCFSDLDTARAFVEQFGGAFFKTTGT